MPQKWEIAAGTNMTQQWRMRLTKFLSTLGQSEVNQAANIEQQGELNQVKRIKVKGG